MRFARKRTLTFNNMKLQETLIHIETLACSLAKQIVILKDFEFTYAQEVNNLLSNETLKRYKSNAKTLKFPYENYCVQIESDELEEGLLIQSWSSMGSLLESTLQMFVAFYYSDYIKSKNNIWSEDVIKRLTIIVKEDLNTKLKELVADNEIDFNGKNREKFIAKVKNIIKEKNNLQSIDKLTLEPLISFYLSNSILLSRDYSEKELRLIRDYRNSIHSFQKRTIGDWNELNYYGKILLMLLIDIHHRLPDIPYEIPIPITLQLVLRLESQWFEYDW